MSVSVFATLRRKRDRSRGAAGNGTTLVPEAKSEPLFNSTPNLNKISVNVKKPSNALSGHSHMKHKENTTVFYPQELDDVIVEDEDDDAGRYGGFSSRRSSSAAVETDGAGGRKFSTGKGKGSSGSLRHFASMISMFGSLKRAKSSRRVAFGSSQDIEPEKREGAEFMRGRAAGKSPELEVHFHHPSKSSHSQSQKNAEETDRTEVDSTNSERSLTNTEPGVRSSSSSSDDDIDRRDNFHKSDSIPKHSEQEQPDFEYTTTKSEEELKRTKIMIQGIKKFNMEPKKGIEFLVENDILQNTADDVAKFLKFGEGLSKTAIGKYLGEHVDFNEEVLQAFLDLHNFKDLILVQALREFLWSFRLPGESQKIDRMMEAFAKRYCQSNPGIFGSTDTCYLLSYSIIMLNTTLHNPSVKDKPTVEQFIQMNRDVDCGRSLNRVFLIHLYNSILTEPFKIPPEDANDLVLTFFNPNIEGWLWKQGGYKTWKRRWFILSNNCLYYFKFTTDKSPRGIIPLENLNAKEVSGSKSNELFPFILFKKSSTSMPSDVIKTCKTLSNGTTVLSQYHTITLASINQEDRKKWVFSINQNISNSDFYDVLTIKKRNMEAARHHHHGHQKRTETGGRVDHHNNQSSHKEDGQQRVPIRKSLISQPSTVPNFEYKHELPPELLIPAGPQKDPNNYFVNQPVFSNSSAASISSTGGGLGGAGVERDSSYGSFSDISRSRSESRIADCTHEGSMSSVEHDTGSLGSQGEERLYKYQTQSTADNSDSVNIKDAKFDLSKKLSVIEESQSQNQSDRSSGSSGANVLIDMEDSTSPVCLGYRKLSEENFIESQSQYYDRKQGACSSDSSSNSVKKCDNVNFQNKPTSSAKPNQLLTENPATSFSSRYSRSGSIESDV